MQHIARSAKMTKNQINKESAFFWCKFETRGVSGSKDTHYEGYIFQRAAQRESQLSVRLEWLQKKQEVGLVQKQPLQVAALKNVSCTRD